MCDGLLVPNKYTFSTNLVLRGAIVDNLSILPRVQMGTVSSAERAGETFCSHITQDTVAAIPVD